MKEEAIRACAPLVLPLLPDLLLHLQRIFK